jgi:hypothetical protein
VPTLHRFNVAAVFLIELVHEDDRGRISGELVEAASDPFIPTGDEDKFGILLQSVLPLFGEVETMQFCIRGGILFSMAVASPQRSRVTHRAQFSIGRILGDADRHLLLLARCIQEDVINTPLPLFGRVSTFDLP